MTSTPVRRRAPGMSPEERRKMLVAAALPLVAEHGAAVTTQQIARAAGIGEATIFRVFPDKEALLNACVAEALDPTNLLGELGSISLDQPLAARLVEAADALRAHLDRMGTVIAALHASGHHRRPVPHEQPVPEHAQGHGAAAVHEHLAAAHGHAPTPPHAEQPSPAGSSSPGGSPPPSGSREAQSAILHEAVAELFEPDAATLRLPAPVLAGAFLGLVFGHGRVPFDSPHRSVGTQELVDLFLYGAFTRPPEPA